MNRHIKQYWLPILIAIIGICLSVLLAYNALQLIKTAMPSLIIQLEALLPWLSLLFGVTISVLLAVAIIAIQLARERAVTLDQAREYLKNEVAERLQTEESKQKLEKALAQGQKLQAVGTLAGGIAHDFNNLLYAIKGYIEMTREDVQKESIAYKNLGRVLEATDRGEELVSRILAFSRRHHPELKSIELNSTLEAILELLRPSIPTHVTLHFEHSKPCIVLGNQTQIHQVIVNIINNAVDAMNGEGNITVRLKPITANNPLLKQFPHIPIQNYCKIEISDTGSGMDPQTVERFFEPFYTTKEVGKGTGLVLSIVHTIIKDHHGEISVTSQLGHGTTFILLLPEYVRQNEGE